MNFGFLMLLYILFELKYVKGYCSHLFDANNSPILLQKIGKENLLLPISDGLLSFDESNEIIAVCPSGFTNVNYMDSNGYREEKLENIISDTIILKCVNAVTKIKIEENTFKIFKSGNCKNSAKSQIFEISSIENCEKNNYSIGLNIENSSMIFADICFDLDNMRLEFVHYIATLFTPVLSHQIKTNENLDYFIKTEAPDKSFFIDDTLANILIKNIIGHQADFLTFQYYELYPSDNLYPYITEPLQISKNFIRFLGWTNFIQGNWKSFMDLLKSRSEKFTYDVYLGTSDVVTVPSNNCNPLKKLILKEYTKTVSVPKYVWSYLKSRDNKTDEFVVIGVNSPYFEFSPKKEMVFCDDICNEIDWLHSLQFNRKKSVFGYLFCCRKDQVLDKLYGFPRFIYQENSTYT